MSADYTAGRYRVSTGNGFPPSLEIEQLHPNGSGEVLERMTVRHKEIADLEHVLRRGKADCRRRLGWRFAAEIE